MKLFPNCRLVEGPIKRIMYDLDREAYHEINTPEDLTPFLFEQGKLKDEQHPFKWSSPSLITNAVIYISKENGLYQPSTFSNLLKELEKMLCKHLVLKLDVRLSFEELFLVFDQLKAYNIQSVLTLFTYKEEYHSDEFGEFIIQFPMINTAIILESPFEANYEDIFFFTRHQNTPKFDKKPSEFLCSITLFAEAQEHNPYFNRKLFIGSKGEIKNAEECAEIHGKINPLFDWGELKLIVKSTEFQKYWFVNKDRCKTCNTCPYRYMCVDNRVPHYNEKIAMWDYEKSCNYNPKTNEWTDLIVQK